jgi:ABC-type ATPase involved in cell division
VAKAACSHRPALINEPTILLADDNRNLTTKPTENHYLLQTIHKIHGATLVIATHDKNIVKAAQKSSN